MRVVDSHTAGEPTRVVLEGGPDLGTGPLRDRVQRFRERFDHFRTAIIAEPRGSEVIVGAFLVPPEDPRCTAGVIFVNNVGYLGMCGHGTMGLMTTLADCGQIRPGRHLLETPVGIITAELHDDGTTSVENVPSWRARADVSLQLADGQQVQGDVAWGGNWFFLTDDHGLGIGLSHLERLTRRALNLREAAARQGFPEIDHIELFGPPSGDHADSQSFVLCPGGAYDRSPCGTGTSAKLACLAARGKLQPGETWVQESVIGSTFSARYAWEDDSHTRIRPTITGRASITAEMRLRFDPNDPYAWGIGVPSRA